MLIKVLCPATTATTRFQLNKGHTGRHGTISNYSLAFFDGVLYKLAICFFCIKLYFMDIVSISSHQGPQCEIEYIAIWRTWEWKGHLDFMGSPHSVVLSLFLSIYSVIMAHDFYLQIPLIVGGLEDWLGWGDVEDNGDTNRVLLNKQSSGILVIVGVKLWEEYNSAVVIKDSIKCVIRGKI